MAENYEEYEPSDSYGEDELNNTAGGEQMAAAIYVNEAMQKQQEEISQKANPVFIQPSTPPENPRLGDMWIDTSIFPHTIYAWDGVEWKRSTVISAEEVGAYTVAQSDEQMANVRLDLSALDERTTIVEQDITADSIVDKVVQHQTYIDSQTSTANQAITDIEGKLKDEEYVKENYPTMVTDSKLEQKASEIIASFSQGGGVNLLENSVGYAGTDRWQVMSGSISHVVGSEMVDSKSGFAISTGVMTQVVPVEVGREYTMTLRIKKGTAGTAWLKLSDGTTFQQMDLIDTQAYDYSIIQIPAFIPDSTTLIVEIGASGAEEAIFTALMLNTGSVGYQWSLANGEVANTNVRMDINGLRVESTVYDGYTVMSPEEFSGYARNGQGVMEKVFTLNKDTTEMTKVAVDDEIMMNSLKIININGGGYRGWAIVPST